MGALPSSLAPSLASEYAANSAWLANDVTDPAGKVPVTTGPVEPVDDPVNGTAPVDLNPSPLPWQEPELAEGQPDYFYSSAFPHAGPWPALPEEGDGKEPLGTWPTPPGPVPGEYKVPPAVTGLAQGRALLPGHDAHAQVTDTGGWDQYTPSGRTAVRQRWWQSYPGVENFWPVTQPTMARVRIARGADQPVAGVVAEYGGLAGAGGDTAYEPPQPPATSTVPATAGAGTIPQWGF